MKDFKPVVEWVPIGKLIPYVHNAKRHPEDQIDKIAAQMQEYGFTQPILMDENYSVIAGHGRLLAAKKTKPANRTSYQIPGTYRKPKEGTENR